MPADCRVMVVEDDASSRSALAELLRYWGYQPETASGAIEALRKIKAWRPSVVISDLQMPGMSGLELIQALGRSAPEICCIAVTGGGTSEKATLLEVPGVVDFLEKPLDPRKLWQDLQKCLARHRPH